MLTIIKKGTPKKEIRERILRASSRVPEKEIMQYAGRLKISQDPLEYQIEIRNEWEQNFRRY